MKKRLRDCLFALALLIMFVAGGVIVTLIASSMAAHFLYSNGAEPRENFFSVFISNSIYILSWGLFLMIPLIIFGTIVFGVLRVLACLRAPRFLLVIYGCCLAGTISFFSVVAAGWYINMPYFPVWVGGILGVVWAFFVLPKYLGSTPVQHPTFFQWSLILLVVLSTSGAMYWQFFMPSSHSEDPPVNVSNPLTLNEEAILRSSFSQDAG